MSYLFLLFMSLLSWLIFADDDSNALAIDTSRYHINGTCNLQILDVTMSKSGSYMCDISGKMNYTTQLTVIGRKEGINWIDAELLYIIG